MNDFEINTLNQLNLCERVDEGIQLIMSGLKELETV